MDAPCEAIDAFLSAQRPRAGALDRDPTALADALAEMGRRGLLGLRIPAAYGGAGFTPLQLARFQESIARTSGALAFLQTQHQSACGLIAASDDPALRARLLPGLARGAPASGIAFSHLRRPGPPLLRATPRPGGWRVDGRAPWITGWGFFGACVTAATLPDGRVLFFHHALAEGPSLRASSPMALAALEVARTVAVDFSGLEVPASARVAIHDSDWLAERDRLGVARQSASALGCAGAALDALQEVTAQRGLPPGPAAALAIELERARAAVYALVDAPPDLPSAQRARRRFEAGLAARAQAIALMGRCAHAAVAASAGAANLADHPAQRIWREALLFTVLSQDRQVREGTLAALASPYEAPR